VMEVSFPTSRRSLMTIWWRKYHFILQKHRVMATYPVHLMWWKHHFILPEELKHGNVTIIPSVEDMALSNSRRPSLRGITTIFGVWRECHFRFPEELSWRCSYIVTWRLKVWIVEP
jgi:hypothetical protein